MKCKLTLVNVDGQFFFLISKKKIFPDTNLNINTGEKWIREKHWLNNYSTMNNFVLSSRFFKFSSSISRFTSRSLFNPLQETQILLIKISRKKERKEGRKEGRRKLFKSIVSTPTFSPLPSSSNGISTRDRGTEEEETVVFTRDFFYTHLHAASAIQPGVRSSPVSSRYLMNFVPRIEETLAIAFSPHRHPAVATDERPLTIALFRCRGKEVAILDPALLATSRW